MREPDLNEMRQDYEAQEQALLTRAGRIRKQIRRMWETTDRWIAEADKRFLKASGCLLDERRSNRISWAVLVYAACVMIGYAIRWAVER